MHKEGAINFPGLKRSVERTKNTRRRVVTLGNSPVLSRKRSRSGEEDSEDDLFAHPQKKMATNDALLSALNDIKGTIQGINTRLHDCATKEDILCIRTELRCELKMTTDRIKNVEARQETFNAGLDDRISYVFDRRIADL